MKCGNRITRRALLAAVGQLSLGSILAACKPLLQPTGNPGSQPTRAQTTGTPSLTPAAVPTKKQDLSGEIVVAVSTGSHKAWQLVAQEYMRLQPKVKVTIALQREGVTLRDRYYREQITAGAPQLSLATVNTLGDLFSKQAFINWYPYLKQVNPYTNQVWQDMFEPASLSFASADSGHQYMLSTEFLQMVFFFNRSLVQRFGLDADSPPQTYDDLKRWASAGNENVASFDIWESSGQLDWLTRVFADPWYAAPEYWQLCACRSGDACFDPSKPAFPAADWALNPHFDDPELVDFNALRAWEAFDQGHFLGELDTSIAPLLDNLLAVLSAANLPPTWRTEARSEPLAFYTNQALMFPTGSYFISSFIQARQQLKSGSIGSWPEGRQTPTPNPALQRAGDFELGVFACPRQTQAQLKMQYQRTIEQPTGFWGIPRKLAPQNELEVDFVMYITSPEVVALKITQELDTENAEGNLIGLSTVKGVALPEPWRNLYAGLHPQGNVQKPHPLNMVFGGLPSTLNQRIAITADFLEGKLDGAACISALRQLREGGREDELAVIK
ncbi:MAG: hypothetical protein ACYC6L_17085 [Anaerolineae bacterium]